MMGGMNGRGPVARRFWLGNALPIGLLSVFIVYLVVVTGHGKEWAPLAMLAASVVIVPVTMLVNCWVLFTHFSDRLVLFLAGLVLPFVVAAALTAYLHGTGDARHAGELFLVPFLMSLVAVGNHPLAAFAIWVLAMTLALLAARAVHARRTAAE
jgi:hypothetical protein